MYYLYSSTIHPVFQLTTSRGGRRIPITLYPAISVFQLTTSRRSRRVMHFSWSLPKLISTHDLTKRSTLMSTIWYKKCLFQLTTSRRGRRQISHLIIFLLTFQLTTSRRGRPKFAGMQNGKNSISTHDLTKRSTDSGSL